MSTEGGARFRLLPAPPAPARVVPDPTQQEVIDTVATVGHGPVLVLAGPGTGKTTTIVESVAARVAAGTPPHEVLVLTFSRRAAMELRRRLTTRLAVAVAEPLAWTFHAFGYQLLTRAWQAADPADADAADAVVTPRLLSGPEQDVVVRDLLAGSSVGWPAELGPALGTRGFADEVRSLLGRARSLGLDPERLAAVAAGRGDWVAVADFYGEYLDVLALSGSLDYAELVAQAVGYAESEQGRTELGRRWSLVVVDEYQDTDPEQERLVQALAGDGRDLVVVGDPDQSIYGFRGAQVANLLSFARRFPRRDGSSARVLTLDVSRRCPPAVVQASRRVAGRIPLTGLPSGTADQHRRLRAPPATQPGSVEVVVHPSATDEVAHVADILREEHLRSGTPWSQMAVLVRSAAVAVPALRRALTAAGVPVDVAGDEVPLSEEPAVAPLLLALRMAVEPSAVTPLQSRQLLLSPLGGTDSGRLRHLGRLLRRRARAELAAGGHPPLPPSSDSLVHDALWRPELLDDLPDRFSQPVRRLAGILTDAVGATAAGASTYAVLWGLWSSSGWGRRLERTALSGGAAAAAAHRDLDAALALFDAAARTEERVARRGVRGFLDELSAQQIPGDSLAERGVRPEAVRLLTAHRAKGLEWDVVVVPGVQAETWPDLRHRGSLLDIERLTADGEGAPAPLRAVLAEERRLFYVAVTRARRRLVVSAVDAAADDGLRPSPFLDDLVEPRDAVPSDVPTERLPDVHRRDPGLAPRSLSVAPLVAELRATLLDPSASPALQDHAAAALAAFAEAGVRAADPDHWWGLRPLTVAAPVRLPDEPLRLSGTSLATLADCPLRWFLEHEAGAGRARSVAMGFGSVVHALADELGRGLVTADVDALDARVSAVWDHLGFEAPWHSERERESARAALVRLLQWLDEPRGRDMVDTEVRFDHQLQLSGDAGPVIVQLRGFIDRLEVDQSGRVWVVDFKTGRSKPTNTSVAQHVQLGLYQYAIADGALSARGLADAPTVKAGTEVAGAELVQLRHDAARGAAGPYVQQQPALQADPSGRTFVDVLLADAVEVISQERYFPRPSDDCARCPVRMACPAQPAGRQVLQ